MKLIYSTLQKLLPALDKDPRTLRDDLTMIGHFTNFYEEIEGEIVFDLDIKVNRGDALSYYGLARDLSVYYNIPLTLPTYNVIASVAKQSLSLPIRVLSPDVLRFQAIKLSAISNLTSPNWLKKFLKLHNINSINTLVDLTNYVMLFWGLPNHAFDVRKTSENLIWTNIDKATDFTTLDGSELVLHKPVLAISNPSEVLSLSFIGGHNSGIDEQTTETIIEMAVYNPARVRSDWRSLKTVTEAAIRLEKELDPDTIPLAFNHLINLIQQETHAQISSDLFEYYPHPIKIAPITLDFNQPSKVSGIAIPKDFIIDSLTRLGCTVDGNLVTPPSIRKDITAQEDLVEEAVRFWGYQKIPTTQPLVSASYSDITPKIIYSVEELKDKLISLGYDEVLTWPLVAEAHSPRSIATQNSINSEYPYLRESIIQSLATQVDRYRRLKLSEIQIFEIGKVFYYDREGTPVEKFSLGLYHSDSHQLSADLTILNLIAPINDNFAEIIIDELPSLKEYIPNNTSNNAIELTSQLITLDANIEFEQEQDSEKILSQYQAKIKEHLWQIIISDKFKDPKTNKYRYTLRVTYFNCDDKTAKNIHAQVFNLKV